MRQPDKHPPPKLPPAKGRRFRLGLLDAGWLGESQTQNHIRRITGPKAKAIMTVAVELRLYLITRMLLDLSDDGRLVAVEIERDMA